MIVLNFVGSEEIFKIFEHDFLVSLKVKGQSCGFLETTVRFVEVKEVCRLLLLLLLLVDLDLIIN